MGSQSQNQRKITQRPSIIPEQAVLLQRKCACGQHTLAGGECEECHQKREGIIQRAAVSVAPVNIVPPIVHDVLSSSGKPLDAGTRAFMEPRFGYDFSQVRVHTDARAAESARAVNALAYTVGKDVVFGTGHYTPETSVGRRLLAHELTHTIHQSQKDTSKAGALQVSSPDDRYEHEADHMATVVSHDVLASEGNDMKGQHIGAVGYPVVQRQEASDPMRMRKPPTPDLSYHPPQSTEPPGTQGLPDPLTKSALQSAVQSSFPNFKTNVTIAKSASGNRLILYILGIKIQSPSKESFSVGAEGVTIGTARGSLGIGFGGDISITKTDGPVKFAASIGKDHWKVNVSYPLTTSVPDMDKLRGIFVGANTAITGITDDIANFRDFETVKSRIGPRVGPLKSAIDAVQGIAAAPPGPSFGVSVSGGTGGETGQEGIRFQATFTYRF